MDTKQAIALVKEYAASIERANAAARVRAEYCRVQYSYKVQDENYAAMEDGRAEVIKAENLAVEQEAALQTIIVQKLTGRL